MYLKLTNGLPEIYSTDQLRRDNPQVSFPTTLSDELLADYGVYPYTVQDQPTVDYMTQALTAMPLVEINGVWTQGWEVSNLSIEDASHNIRNQRDNLLQQTDWMALSDTIMPPEITAYRQALRDITEQAGFPYSVEWPIKP